MNALDLALVAVGIGAVAFLIAVLIGPGQDPPDEEETGPEPPRPLDRFDRWNR